MHAVLALAYAYDINKNVYSALAIVGKGDEADGLAHAFISDFIDGNLNAVRLGDTGADPEGATHKAQGQQNFFHKQSPFVTAHEAKSPPAMKPY
ncbi:hypothetical protein Defa_21450 [Desulfovibrio sp. TH_2024_36128]|uniref:Uncharacterized protein n=1 Tax=Desulfovibrio falkowii TaxID=3136602 RepID=A0ABQ0EA94_9BACT